MGLLDSFLTGGLGSLAGGILGSVGSIINNQNQLKIARETNAMNRKMFDDQLAYNTEMWNKQNEYNDPLAQRQRLENAGFNPLFHGLDGTGNASGWQSATPIPAQGASVENPLAGLAAGLAGMSDSRLKESQKENTDAKTQTENVMRGLNKDFKERELNQLNYEVGILRKNFENWQKTFDLDVEHKEAVIADLKSQGYTRETLAFNDIQEFFLHAKEVRNDMVKFWASYELEKGINELDIQIKDLQATLLAFDVESAPDEYYSKALGVTGQELKNMAARNELIYLAPRLYLEVRKLGQDIKFDQVRLFLDAFKTILSTMPSGTPIPKAK